MYSISFLTIALDHQKVLQPEPHPSNRRAGYRELGEGRWLDARLTWLVSPPSCLGGLKLFLFFYFFFLGHVSPESESCSIWQSWFVTLGQTVSNGFQLHLLLLFVVAVGGGVADWQLATVGAALVLPVSHGSIREALSNLRVNRRSSHLLFVLTCV